MVRLVFLAPILLAAWAADSRRERVDRALASAEQLRSRCELQAAKELLERVLADYPDEADLLIELVPLIRLDAAGREREQRLLKGS